MTAALAPPDMASFTYECRWTDHPIALDGFDDPAWRGAQSISRFIAFWKQGNAAQPTEPTRAWLLWDENYLYFRADMTDADLYADVTEHNGPIWNNDAFELFFKPDPAGGYYEFEVNPANARMELFLPTRDSGGYPRFRNETHIEMETQVRLRGTLNHWQDRDEGWSVIGRIPWRDMQYTGGRPADHAVWRFAACRVDFGVNVVSPELSSCAPFTQASFHRYEDYAILRFVGPRGSQAADTRSSPGPK